MVTVAFFPLLAVLTGTIAMLTSDATFVLNAGELHTLLGEPIGIALRIVLILGIVAWFGTRTGRRDGKLPLPPPSQRSV